VIAEAEISRRRRVQERIVPSTAPSAPLGQRIPRVGWGFACRREELQAVSTTGLLMSARIIHSLVDFGTDRHPWCPAEPRYRATPTRARKKKKKPRDYPAPSIPLPHWARRHPHSQAVRSAQSQNRPGCSLPVIACGRVRVLTATAQPSCKATLQGRSLSEGWSERAPGWAGDGSAQQPQVGGQKEAREGALPIR